MERLNLELARALGSAGPLSVVGPAQCAAHLPVGAFARQIPVNPLGLFLLRTLFQTLYLALRRRPSLIVAGSGLCAPFAWLASRMIGAQCALYLHGLDIVADSFAYRAGWLPFIRRFDMCVVNSRNTRKLAIEAGVPPDRITVVHPGTDVPGDAPLPAVIENFRQANGWAGRQVLLSVGRLTVRKGLTDFVVKALPDLVKSHPTVLLAVIGNDAPDALLRGSVNVRATIEERAESLGLASHIVFMGEVSDEELSNAYAAADAAIFPVRTLPGDVEGFGMVAVEAAARGLPTVAFAAGGVPDAVLDGVSGKLLTEDDYSAFTKAVGEVLDRGRSSWETGCKGFAKSMDWERFACSLFNALGLNQ